MVDMCVDYADEYNIKFNGSKSSMFYLKPLDVQLKYRFICFLKKCLDHDNATVRNVALIALNNHMSCAIIDKS